jgi:hypothetical protein
MSGKRATKIDAMLAHLATGGDALDFAGTKYENLALARTLHDRGLIAWDGERNRFGLTPAGWSALTPRRFGLPSLAASAAMGAIAVAALAFLLLPGARSQNSAHSTVAATVAVQSPAAAPAPVPTPAAIAGRSVAPMPASAPQPAPAARASAAESTLPPVTPLDLTEVAQPAPEQTSAEAVPTNAKPAAVKKQPRRTARPAEQPNAFANFFASFGRPREPAQSRPREVTQTRARAPSQTRSGQSSGFHI